jgi:hypothetical protein
MYHAISTYIPSENHMVGPELQATLIGSGIAVVSALAGYAFREWRNHARPFIAVTEFRGDLRLPDESEIAVPDSVVSALADAFFLEPLAARESLGQLYGVLVESEELLSRMPTIVQSLDGTIAAIRANVGDEELCAVLGDLLDPLYMDEYCLCAITGG